MNRSIIVLFIFIVGVLTGYSLHESKEKIEIHQEANRIFHEYQNEQVKKFISNLPMNNSSQIWYISEK